MKLFSGTLLKKCPWDSCFENPSENADSTFSYFLAQCVNCWPPKMQSGFDSAVMGLEK